MIPFIASKDMWQRGVGGIDSFDGCLCIWCDWNVRLVRGMFCGEGKPGGRARVAAWTAAIVYAANPNLIYMQTTAMGEALYLAFFIWAVVFFGESYGGDAKALTKCGLCLAAACLTRYDGWFLAVAVALVVVLLRSCFQGKRRRNNPQPSSFREQLVAKFFLLMAAAPVLWLAYNGIVYRNPLEFANGPYSAKAIERRTQKSAIPGTPAGGNISWLECIF